MKLILVTILSFLTTIVFSQEIIRANGFYIAPKVAASVGFTGGLLDTFPTASAAYSLRRLRLGYTGSAIRVYNSLTSIEQDIGFTTNGDLDTAALKTFLVSAGGYLKTWYDQSGNGKDATVAVPSTPTYISDGGGVIHRQGVMPAIGTGAVAFTMSNITYSNAFTVVKRTTTSVLNVFASTEASGVNELYVWSSSSGFGGYDGTHLVGSAIGNDANRHLGYFNMASSALYTAIDGGTASSVGTFNSSLNAVSLFGRSCCNLFLRGDVQELIFYTSEQSANKTGIEANINRYWTIY